MVNPGKFDPSATIESFYKFGERVAIPKEKMDRILDSPFKLNSARLLRHAQDFYSVFSSLGLCMRVHMAQFYYMDRFAELYSAVTGIKTDTSEIKLAGERIWNIFKALNVREGQTRNDDILPQIAFEPLQFGDQEFRMRDQFETKFLTSEDIEQMKDDFYDESGWEVERGIPTKDKLIELGLADIAEELEKKHGL